MLSATSPRILLADYNRIKADKKAAAERARRELEAEELKQRRAQWQKLQEEFGDIDEPSKKWRLGVEEEPVGRDPLVGPPGPMVTEPDDEATQPPSGVTLDLTGDHAAGWGWY